MTPRTPGLTDEELLDAALAALSSRLPPDWSVERTRLGGADEDRDLLIKAPYGPRRPPSW